MDVPSDLSFLEIAERGTLNAGATPDAQADKTLWTEFYRKPVLDLDASKAAGRQVYQDKVYIRIGAPGQRDVVDRPYWDNKHHPYSDSARFGDRYEKWLANEAESAMDGTPLSLFATMVPQLLTLSEVKEYEFFHVRTAEQLVAMPDEAGQKMAGFQETKRKVQAYLELQASGAPQAKLQVELEDAQARLHAQGELLQEMRAEMDALKKKAQKRDAQSQP